MVVVSAVAFVAGALCLYYGARALRTKRAIRRLDRSDDPADLIGWRDEERGPDGSDADRNRADRSDADRNRADRNREDRSNADSRSAANRDDDVQFERGFVLLVLGLLCVLFGILAL